MSDKPPDRIRYVWQGDIEYVRSDLFDAVCAELGQAYKKLHEFIPVEHKDRHFTYDASVLKGDISNGRITDEFGNLWELNCPICGAVLQVIEPGIARCSAACAEPTPTPKEMHT